MQVASVSAACNIYLPKSNLAFGYANYSAYEIQSPSKFTIDPTESDLKWQGQALQSSYNYLALDFPAEFPDAPLTNGHLHTIVFGYADTLKTTSSDNTNHVHWSVLPTIAVSSNQLKNPETLEAESFRLDGHLVWERTMQHNWSLFGGLCVGSLSGEYEAIPIVGFSHRRPKWALTLAYPQTQFQYVLTSTVKFQSHWSLSGNQWSVLDHDLEIRSDFNFRSQRIKLGFTLATPNIGDFEVYWLYLFNQQMSYLARSGSRISVDADNTSGWMIRYVHQL